MTEIRIYEDHNKVVVAAETKNMYDKLFIALSDIPECEEEWHDEEWTYMRLPLDKFMSAIKELMK